MRARGYTLIEMAITLIVIGLLLAAVLTAEAAVGASRVRSFVRDAEALSTALQLYRARYGALPGDDTAAGSRWAGVPSGNGNGTIGGRYDRTIPGDVAALASGSDDSESLLVWWHLRRAGLINGAVDGIASVTPPMSASQQPLGIQADLLGLPGTVTCVADASGATAEAIDHAMDDGAPHTGIVRATSSGVVTTRYSHDAHYQLCVSLERRAGPALTTASSAPTADGGTTTAPASTASATPAAGDTTTSGTTATSTSTESSTGASTGTTASNSSANGNSASNGNGTTGSNGNSSSDGNGNSGSNGNSSSNGNGNSSSNGNGNSSSNGNGNSNSNGKGH